MSSNLAQISFILKKKPDVSDQASSNSPHIQYILNDSLEYRMTPNLTQQKELSKYVEGDVVVFIIHNKINNLQTDVAFKTNSNFLLKNGLMVSESEPVLFHKRRLDEIEQSIAEVP